MAMMRYPQMGHAFGRKEGLTGPFVVAAESEEMQVIIIIIMFCNIAVDFNQGEEEWSSTWKKKMKKREC
jgi:hypothetical protein